MTGLDALLPGWLATYHVESAYATWDAGRAALARAGIVAAAPQTDTTEKRDLVMLEIRPDDAEAEIVRLAALATKALIALAPNARRPFAPAARRRVIPLLWRIGRVRDRVAVGDEGVIDDLLPARFHARIARWEAFVVDVSPRTPQARRKLLRTVP